MLRYKQLYMDYMNEKGIKYTDVDENVVRVSYGAKNLRSIAIYVIFDKNENPIVSFKCWEVANFKEKEARALIACNELNKKYRWARFYLNDNAEIVVDCDAQIDESTGGEECARIVSRLVGIIDEAYPTFARALWAE